jgi:hypothetical protein
LIITEKHRLQLMGAFEAAAPLSRKARALLAFEEALAKALAAAPG